MLLHHTEQLQHMSEAQAEHGHETRMSHDLQRVSNGGGCDTSSGSAMVSAFISAYCATSEPSTSSYEPALEYPDTSEPSTSSFEPVLQFPVTPQVLPITPSGGSQQDSMNIHMLYGDVTTDDAAFDHFNN